MYIGALLFIVVFRYIVYMEILSQSFSDTKIATEKFIKNLRKKPQAVIIGLKGDLGAGKTTFVKFAAKSLGVKNHITSPTFVILKSYKLKAPTSHKATEGRGKSPASPAGRYKLMYHIDAYRLKEAKELKNLGWDNIVKDPNNIIFLEWPEKVKDILPEDTIFIHLTAKGAEHNKRLIKFL
jgi:tRNA threonylcarbamoyladenosine biosynthesis protein TsaE